MEEIKKEVKPHGIWASLRLLLLFLFLGILLLDVLAYFKIIPLEKFLSLFPLPKTSQKKPQETLKVAPPLIPLKSYEKKLQDGSFACPTLQFVCKNPQNFKEGLLSVSLSAGTPIFAAFEGEAQGIRSFHPQTGKANEEFNLVILANKNRGLSALYYLVGKTVGKKTVREGEQIATSSSKTISFMDNKSFVFMFLKTTEKGGESVSLSPANFK